MAEARAVKAGGRTFELPAANFSGVHPRRNPQKTPAMWGGLWVTRHFCLPL